MFSCRERIVKKALFEWSASACRQEGADFLNQMEHDLHSRYSLSAGGPEASSAPFAPVGSPLDTFFPQESRTFHSNQLEWFLK
ncbi:hypothetical protein CQ056_12975 [Peribacillus simplex]|nr:hypothetical protein CQ056_12975 [Peribacillus simplex]